MKVVVNNKDITNICLEYDYSGDMLQRTRCLAVKYLYKKSILYGFIDINVGDSIALFDNDGKKVFLGIVLSVNINSSSSNASLLARDVLWYLSKNKLSGIYEDTVTNITRKILKEFNISIDILAQKDEKKTIISTGDKTINDVIKEAYGDDYYLYANGEKVGVNKKAADLVAVISGEANLNQMSHNSNIEGLINKILIIDEKGKDIGVVDNPKDYIYGLLQDVYKKEEGKDEREEAKKRLKSVEVNSTVNCLGDLKCISGKAIYLVDTSIGFSAKYLIKDDKHTFSRGIHKMSLGLEILEDRNESI